MKSPFPGMDPYLEPYWSDIRLSLQVYSADCLSDQLRGDLCARHNHRFVFNETIRQPFIEILECKNLNKVITHIEFLGPTSKIRGDGLDQYLQKQKDLKRDQLNLVEIDLLRGGCRDLVARLPKVTEPTYRVLVRPGWEPELTEVWPILLRQPLPRIKIPLRQPDKDIVLDLQPLLEKAYRKGRYADTIDYRQPCDPPLEGEEAKWADELLRAAGKR